MRAKVINSHHGDIHLGAIGVVEGPLVSQGTDGFVVHFEALKTGAIEFDRKPRPVTAWFATNEIELLADEKKIIAIAETNGVELPNIRPAITICNAINPLLCSVLCQLPPGHKGKHRAEATFFGMEQTFLW